VFAYAKDFSATLEMTCEWLRNLKRLEKIKIKKDKIGMFGVKF
jgi:hypothetical protein